MTAFKRPVLIVDDQKIARDDIIEKLETFYPDFEIIGQYEHTDSAWSVIISGKVEGVFLDVNFQEEGEEAGLELGEKISLLPKERRPWIVYVTNYPEHSYRSHKSFPISFLRKGSDIHEFDGVCRKIRELFPKFVELKYRTDEAVDGRKLDSSAGGQQQIVHKWVNIEDIVHIYTRKGDNNTKKSTVNLINNQAIENVIDNSSIWVDIPFYITIDRATIINLKHVDSYRNDGNKIQIYLPSLNKELPVSEDNTQAFKTAFNKLKNSED